jgi:hypothetical protein
MNRKKSTLIFGMFLILIVTVISCKKASDKPGEKQSITAIAKSINMQTPTSDLTLTSASIHFDYQGKDYRIGMNRLNAGSSSDGTVAIKTTDMVADNSTFYTLPYVTHETTAISNATLPNEIDLSLANDPHFSNIKMTFDSNTLVMLDDIQNFSSYQNNLQLFDNNVKVMADQLAVLPFRISVE